MITDHLICMFQFNWKCPLFNDGSEFDSQQGTRYEIKSHSNTINIHFRYFTFFFFTQLNPLTIQPPYIICIIDSESEDNRSTFTTNSYTKLVMKLMNKLKTNYIIMILIIIISLKIVLN